MNKGVWLGIWLLCVGFSSASVTVDYTAQLGQRNVVDHAESAILSGMGEVRLGVLSTGFDPEVHAGYLQLLGQAWVELGKTEIRPIFGQEGRFSDAAIFDRPELAGQKLYLWVLKTTDGGPVSNDFSNVADYGVYSSTDSDWNIPPQDALPPENSTLINTTQVDQSFGPGGYNETSLQLRQAPEIGLNYETWALNTFPAETPLVDREPGSDPDHDGLINLWEHFTGNNPLVANTNASQITMTVESDAIVVEFDRAKNIAARGVVEVSIDLQEWLEVNGTETVGGSSGGGGGEVETEHVSIRVPVSVTHLSEGRDFVRVRIQQ